MNRRKRQKHSICLISAIIMFTITAGHVFAGSISDVQKEKEELRNQLQEAQVLIDNLSDSKEDVESNVQVLDAELSEIAAQITNLEGQLSQKEVEITDTQQELKEAQADVESQYESMKKRIRVMYENSVRDSYLEMLLSAGSVSELLNRAAYIRKLTDYDRNMLARYQKTVETVTNLEGTLEGELAELAELSGQVQKEQEAVNALLGEKQNQLAQIGQELSDAEQLAQYYQAEIQAQDEMIAMIQQEEARKKAEAEQKKAEAEQKKAEEERKKQEEERKKQEEERKKQEDKKEQVDSSTEEDDGDSDSGSSDDSNKEDGSSDSGSTEDSSVEEEPEEPTYNGGAFTWPCPASTRITSDYGPRKSPTAGASSYHRGIDVGAPTGTDIVSAADGVVSFAGYSSGGGNYITVSHGSGVYTIYMHCSELVAGAGQQVKAGQVIAKVGNTGISTGSHLHFGVSVNGSYVSPWEYLK